MVGRRLVPSWARGVGGCTGVDQCSKGVGLDAWWVDSQRGSIVLGPGFGTWRWFLHSAMAAPRVARRVSLVLPAGSE